MHVFQSIGYGLKSHKHSLQFSAKPSDERPVYSDARKQRQEKFYQELKSLSDEGKMALREIFALATTAPNNLGFHAYYARILGGKYPEIRPLLMQEALGLEMVARGSEEEAEEARQVRKDFQEAARRLAKDPSPVSPNYIPVKKIPKAEANAYYEAFNAATKDEYNAFILKYPHIRRRK